MTGKVGAFAKVDASVRVLTLCGSLRARSSNRALLRACEHLAPQDIGFDHHEGIDLLPHFNPDLDIDPAPPAVAGFRDKVAAARALLISTPEYVHALPGSFKNALDWLVSDPRFSGKPVAILHVARGTAWALDSLREVLATMSARIIEPACVSIPLGSNQLDAEAILARPDLRAPLATAVQALAQAIKASTC